MQSGAALLLSALDEYGVDRLFHIPGAETIPLLSEIDRRGTVRAVLVAHEQAAAFGALGYAKLSGRPGACLVIPGPGATNLVTGVAAAKADRVPLLAITTTIPPALAGLGAAHDCDLEALFASIVKAQIAVAQVADIRRAVLDALRIALAPPHGPVQLLIPPALFMAVCERGSADGPTPQGAAPAAFPDAALDRIAAALNASLRPVIYVGRGVTDAGAEAALVQLAERLDAPVLTDICARGLIDERHPLALGCASHRGIAPILADSDACLAVGAGFSEWSTLGWTLPLPEMLLQLDSWPAPAGPRWRPRHAAIGEIGAGLAALLERVGTGRAGNAVSRVRAAKEQACAAVEGSPPASPAPPFHPLAVLRAIRTAMPDEAVAVVDGSATGLWAEEEVLSIHRPRGFLMPEVLKELGSALMVGMGARLAPEGRPVVVIQGDGGFLYQAGELSTLVRERIPLCLVIFEDGFYNADRICEEQFFGGGSDAWRLHNPDFVTLAESFGLTGRRAETLAGLEADVRNALAGDRPFLIAVPIDPRPIPYRFRLAAEARKAVR